MTIRHFSSVRFSPVQCIGLSALGTILAADLLLSRTLVYDERYYVLEPVRLLDQVGLSRQFLLQYPYPAGLSFGILQWLLRPVTHLSPALVRLVDPVLFAAVLWLTRDVARRIGEKRPDDVALTLMAVPFLWVLIGLALTEMIGLLCAMAGGWGLLVAIEAYDRRERITAVVCSGALVSGLVLGLGFYSRPPVVVIAAASAVFLVRRPRLWPVPLFFTIGVAIAVLPVAILWGGLVPPRVGFYSSFLFSLSNMLLSLAYAGTAMVFVCLGWYRLRLRTITALFVTGLALNLLLHVVTVVPLATVARRVMPDALLPIYASTMGGFLCGVGLVFAAATLVNIWTHKDDDTGWLFTAVSLMLLVVAAGKVTHQFSSRYTAMAAPMLVLASGRFQSETGWRVVRVAVGALIGALSLASYFSSQG